MPFTAMALACALAFLPAAAPAQRDSGRDVAGTQLDVVAAGEVTRVPDLARINAGVVTQATTATEAIRQNAARMAAVRAALERAGIAERDIQTSNLNLHPVYHHQENQPPRLTGYQAMNEVSVRFRDIATTGRILDALVAQGANQINGPMLMIERPEAALDEARLAALQNARARAELYARSLGMRVVRVLSVSESGGVFVPRMRGEVRAMAASQDATNIAPGEQTLTVTLTVSFELQ